MSEEQVSIEELFEPTGHLIYVWARKLYEKETGEKLKEGEEPPKEYYEKAKDYLIERFQKELKRIYYIVQPLLGKEEAVSYIGKEEIIPKTSKSVEEYFKVKFGTTEEEIKRGVFKCPRCGKPTFKKLAEGYWMCTSCLYTISTSKLFKGKEPTV